MVLELKVPTLDSLESTETLKETILTAEPDAQVDVNPDTKMVTVESKAAAATFEQLIVSLGHQIEEAPMDLSGH